MKEKIDEDMTVSSDDKTCRVSHKTNKDESSKEEDTKFSKSTMQSKATAQSKAIADLQETVKLLKETQERMMDQMRYLEDTIIVLSEPDDRSIEYKKRREVAKKIKQKREKIVKSSGDDKDSIEVKREEKRRSSRLEILKRKNQQK